MMLKYVLFIGAILMVGCSKPPINLATYTMPEPPQWAIDFMEGNPESWCRNGFFTQQKEMRLGKTNKTLMLQNDDEGCPSQGNASCEKNTAYIEAENLILVGNQFGDWHCIWQDLDHTGWAHQEQLTLLPFEQLPAQEAWIGEWTFYDNSITITEKNNQLFIEGIAFWHGFNDNVHTGEIFFEAVPQDYTLTLATGEDEYDCAVYLRLIQNHLVVADNRNCGGMNVSFDGVYMRQ